MGHDFCRVAISPGRATSSPWLTVGVKWLSTDATINRDNSSSGRSLGFCPAGNVKSNPASQTCQCTSGGVNDFVVSGWPE